MSLSRYKLHRSYLKCSLDRDLAITNLSVSGSDSTPSLLDPNFSVSGSDSTPSLLDRRPISNTTPKVTKDSSLDRLQSRWQRLQSWRISVALCAITSGLTFFVNLALIIWGSAKGFEGGVATVQEGDCNMTKRLDLWLHLGINLLSTLLLGASNYTMQCLSAPTRDEIDKAHQQRISLDVGTLSFQNLRRISWRRVILWWLLALSSIPLHFMYNSAVFSTLSTHPYSAAVVSHDFLTNASFHEVAVMSAHSDLSFKQNWRVDGNTYDNLDVQRLTALRDDQSKLHNLSNDACLKAYRNELVPDRLDVLAISSTREDGYQTPKYHCGSSVQWTVLDFPIEYCLSQPADSTCKLQFSLVIMVIVILCNFSKTFCMFLTIWNPSWVPLLTLGDAIASFLAQPDPSTVNNCLADKDSFQKVKYACFITLPSWISVVLGYGQETNAANDVLIDKNQLQKAGWDKKIRTSKFEQYRWYHTTSPKRWLLCISL